MNKNTKQTDAKHNAAVLRAFRAKYPPEVLAAARAAWLESYKANPQADARAAWGRALRVAAEKARGR